MRQSITMPALSDTMSNGRLVRWVKHAGDAVKKGETIAEVETDKAIMDVEAFHDGYLSGPLAEVDAEIPVGQTIGYLAETRAELSEAGQTGQLPTQPPATQAGAAVAARPTSMATPERPAAAAAAAAVAPAGAALRVSPYAKALAQKLGVSLAPSATPLRAADVLAAASRPAVPDLNSGPPYRIERNSSFREATAQAMIASLATPTFRITAALPLASLIASAKPVGRSVNLLLARACALTILEHPLFNAVYTSEGIAHRERIDIGIAVDSPEGLITPVLRDVGKRPLSDLAEEWRRLLVRANTRRLAPADYKGATFYLSDLGVFAGVYSFESIVPVGAAALLSVAAVQGDKALCTLNCDHRVVFGGDAARFLQTLEKRMADVAA